jgi:allantoin racemase
MRFAMPGGFATGQQFFEALKDAFDVLYTEGDPNGLDSPKMMSVGLHCRLVGQPARAAGLAKFLDYVLQHEKVWFARRIEIARHWKDHTPDRMKTLLLLNPNTNPQITARLAARVQALLGYGWQVNAVTAPFGQPYISNEASYVQASHATLEVYFQHIGKADAMLVGCFGDPGGFALAEDGRLPSIGLAEAAMREAAMMGDYAIVTGGAAWKPMLERLAFGLGGQIAARLVHVETIALTGAQIANDPMSAQQMLSEACQRAQGSAPGIKSIVLGGAGLMGIAQSIQQACSVKLIDSVDAGARAVEQLETSLKK